MGRSPSFPQKPFQPLWCLKFIFLKWGPNIRALRDVTHQNRMCLFWTSLRMYFVKVRREPFRRTEACTAARGWTSSEDLPLAIISQGPVLLFTTSLPPREENSHLKMMACIRTRATGGNRTIHSKSDLLSKSNRRNIVSLYPDDRSNQGILISPWKLSVILYLPHIKRKVLYFSYCVTPPWAAVIKGHSRIFRVFFGGFRGER